MAQKVNYNDNTTYLTRQITGLMKRLALPVDPELFADAVDRELNFLALTLGRMQKALEDSSFALNRHQVLVDLRIATVLFADLLQGLLTDRFPLADNLELRKPRYGRMRQAARDQVAVLEQWIRESESETPEHYQIVSEEEFVRLLAEEPAGSS
jgi:hypothetical protein